jgi:DNA-binding NarL/FixJ family response regulator
VGEARDGEQSVSMVAELQPELVVLDLAMPGGGSVKALTEPVSLVPAPAVVIYSGLLSADLAGALLRMGASACVARARARASLIEELLRPASMRLGDAQSVAECPRCF